MNVNKPYNKDAAFEVKRRKLELAQNITKILTWDAAAAYVMLDEYQNLCNVERELETTNVFKTK